jgi:hypothetical protein
MWLEDFCLAYRVVGADDDLFIIQYLPLYLAESTRAWLEHLPVDNIHSWADFKRIFVGTFRARTCTLEIPGISRPVNKKQERLYVSTSVAFPSSAMSF